MVYTQRLLERVINNFAERLLGTKTFPLFRIGHEFFFILYSIKFYNTRYLRYLQTTLSNATYKLLYYTTRTNATESKNLWQLRSLNIENKEEKKLNKTYMK